MNEKVYAVYDKLSGRWTGLQLFRTDEEAKRALAMMVNEKEQQTMYNMWPEDIEMYCLGDVETIEKRYLCGGENVKEAASGD